MTASVCITTSTSWTRIWACVMCVCQRGCRAGCRSASTDTTGWQASCADWASIIEWLTMRSAILRTGNGRSASPTDGKQNESTRGSTSSPGAAAPSIGTSPPDTTGAWTSANTPPTSSSANRRICRRSMKIWRARRFLKPDNIATFLGRKLSPQFEGEMGNRFNIRIEGTRIKHTMGPVSIKLYDKFGLILRIETTVNDLTFFKHYREVEHRDGSRETKWASMQKTIYSLPALRELLEAANRRYLEFLSTIEDPRAGI